MEIDEIRDYCLNKKGTTESLPFNQDTLVFKVGNKIFLLLSLEKDLPTFSVKTSPEWSEVLRGEYDQIQGAYHMNKKHWNTVQCKGIKKDLLCKIISHSYDLVYASLTKKIKENIE